MADDNKTLFTAKPLPSLSQWLDENGANGERAEGFEGWTNLSQWAEQLLNRKGENLTPTEQHYLRVWQGMAVAVVELCNLEQAKGITPVRLTQSMPRAMGAMVMYCFASISKDDAPFRSLAKLFAEEFRYGAKFAADALEREREGG